MKLFSNNKWLLVYCIVFSISNIQMSFGLLPPEEVEVCDFDQLINPIQRITENFDDCCNQLKQDFAITFSALTTIKNSLTTCCSFADNEFNATFTALQDFKNTLTTCCAETTVEFQATWTTLAADFNAVFTAISDFETTLTSCCTAIQIDFQGTFTVVNALSALCLNLCSALPVTAPIIISTPGFYCLAADGTGSIIINADNVTLDLNNHTLSGGGLGFGSGIVINAGSNRIIKNGKIRNFDTGISCTDSINTFITGVALDTCFTQAVLATNCSSSNFEDISARNITGIALQFSGLNNQTNSMKSITVAQAEQGFVLASFFNGLLQDCEVLDCASSIAAGTTFNGFVINEGSSNQFVQCTVKNFSSSRSRGFAFNDAANITLKQCSVKNIITTALSLLEVIGFDCTASSTNIQLFECSVVSAQSSGESTGYVLEGSTITAQACLAENCVSTTTNAGNGFEISGSDISLTQCQAFENDNIGFSSQSNNPNLIQFCQSGFNSTAGFIIDASTVTGNSSAYNNALGFNAPSNAPIYNCFATKNGTNYAITVPNTENANKQVNKADPALTGPFAGGNVFM